MILVTVAVVLCVFSLQKEGYHMDEMISFELANAKFNPWIVPTQPEGRLAKYVRENIDGENLAGTLENLTDAASSLLREGKNSPIVTFKADVYPEPVWIDRSSFHRYITTDRGDRFLYPSVYFNVKDDNHPPLHFMLLHTISSILPGEVFPMMGCVLNIGAILGCCLLLMRLGRLLDGSLSFVSLGFYTKTGLLAALLYGLSAGAIASSLLIRMYALVTFFCLLSGYYHVRKWKQPEFDPHDRRIIVVTVLGFWTQYFFLFYCITLALVTSVMIWKERRLLLRKYIFHMLCAAGIGILGFPFAILDVFQSGRGVEVLDQISSGIAGYGVRILAFGQIILRGCFGEIGRWLTVYPLVLLPVAIGIMLWVIKLWRVKALHKITGIFWMLLLPPLVYFLLAARVSPYLVDRYMMPVYPFAIWGIAVVIMRLFEFIKNRPVYLKLVPAALLMIAVGFNLFHYDGEYLYSGYGQQLDVARAYRDLPCICIYEGYSFYENLEEFTQYEKTLLVKPEELENRQDVSSILELDQVMIMEKRGVDIEVMETVLMDKYNLYPAKELVTVSPHGDRIRLWEKGG
jgi:hypothetical protein